MDAVKPNNTPLRFYNLKVGTWVEFSIPEKPEKGKRRGSVMGVDDTTAVIMDEITKGHVSVEQ